MGNEDLEDLKEWFTLIQAVCDSTVLRTIDGIRKRANSVDNSPRKDALNNSRSSDGSSAVFISCCFSPSLKFSHPGCKQWGTHIRNG